MMKGDGFSRSSESGWADSSRNTDDPLFFGNTLVDEFAAAQQVHRLTRDNIKRLVVSAVEASWLTSDAKAKLLGEFRNMSVWNEVA